MRSVRRGGRQKLSKENFIKLLNSSVNQKTDFSAPANGLTLTTVKYPEGYFPEPLIETIRYAEIKTDYKSQL